MVYLVCGIFFTFWLYVFCFMYSFFPLLFDNSDITIIKFIKIDLTRPFNLSLYGFVLLDCSQSTPKVAICFYLIGEPKPSMSSQVPIKHQTEGKRQEWRDKTSVLQV